MEGQERARMTILVAEARRLYAEVGAAAANSETGDGYRLKAHRVLMRCEDRISRREYLYACAVAGVQPVTTTQIAAWVRKNVTYFMRLDETDHVVVAFAAADVFGLRTANGSAPLWVWGLCERQAPRAAQEVVRQRSFFVEKPIRYEPDGDVLFA